MVQLRRLWAPSLLLLSAPAFAYPSDPIEHQQHIGAHHRLTAREIELKKRAAGVAEAFQHAWDGYYKYAFPADELHPVSNTKGYSRNGWGASAIDALSTALIMKNSVIVNQILAFVPTIDFSKSYQDELVSLFETTIRYVGGLLSGHDFLTGPLANLASAQNKKNVAALLTQAQKLADNLAYAFDTPSGVPSNNLRFSNKTTDGSTTNGLATVGTLVLEWTRLADKTGNQTYAALAQKGESYILNPKPLKNSPWPGLVGTNIFISNGTFADNAGGWQGGDDSAYEYLIKMFVYDPNRFSLYRDRWLLAVNSSIKHLASHPTPRPDLTYLAEFEGRTLVNESEHLACFDGGNFILGGTVLKRQDITDFGLQLTASCHNTYNSTVTKIGPEIFSWKNAVPAGQAAFYQKNGFWIPNASYDLRPEVVESYYYAYQATGNHMYQDWAWEAFLALNSTCRTASGFAALNNVNEVNGGGKIDNQESFLFAELLKYHFLMQAAPQEWSVSGTGQNKWVYNTEAHPFKVFGQ